MADLTVRTPQGSWLNICDSEWYLRNEDNTDWNLIDPYMSDVKVRHGSNLYWLDVKCGSDSSYCPQPITIECWSGFTGNFDGGSVIAGGPTGMELVSCDQQKLTYSGTTPSFNIEGGRFTVTSRYFHGYTLPLTWSGGEAQVSEILVNAGSESGLVNLSFDNYGMAEIRFRVYQGCVLLGDSEEHGLTFGVFYTEGNGPLVFRVDTPRAIPWDIKADAVNTDLLTTLHKPAACFGSFGPRMRCVVDGAVYYSRSQAYEAAHAATEGTNYMEFDVKDNPISVFVYYRGELIDSALDIIGNVQMQFDVPSGVADTLIVRIESEKIQHNAWSYSMWCAEQKGSMQNKLIPVEIESAPTCSGTALPPTQVLSRGAPQTVLYVDYSSQAELIGKIYVSYSFSSEAQIVVYNGDEVIAGSTVRKGVGAFGFWVDFQPNRRYLKIVVIGPCCPTWSFSISALAPEPTINILDAEVTRPKSGTANICFPITLDHVFDEPIYLDYKTYELTAVGSPLDSEQCAPILYGGNPPPTYFHPDPNTMHSTWDRWERNVRYKANATNAPSDTKGWVIQNSGGSQHLTTPKNTDYPCAILSDQLFDEYTFEVTLSVLSGSGDDDMIGVVLATSGTEADTRCLCLWRTSYSSQHTYDIMISIDNSRGLESAIPYWSGRVGTWTDNWRPEYSTRVRATRRGNIITIMSTPIFTTGQPAPSYTFKHTIDLDADPALHPFKGVGHYGYATHSQPYSAWKDFVFFNAIEDDAIPVDFAHKQGTLVIPPCTESAEICIPVCGTQRVTPSLTFRLEIDNASIGNIDTDTAIGTIKNSNIANCPQNTSIAVKEHGENVYIQRGAHNMYCGDKVSAYAGFSAVMEMELDFPATGNYKFYFSGQATAEIFMDCQLLKQLKEDEGITEFTYYVYAGRRKFYINYYANMHGKPIQSYAALAITKNSGEVVYASRAAHWRGRILNNGTPPYCRQIPSFCSFTATHGVGDFPSEGTYAIYSLAHAPLATPANTHYLLRRDITLPNTGNYTITAVADDSCDIYLDCRRIFSGILSEGRVTKSFHATSGVHSFVVDYINIPNNTPGYVSFEIKDSNGNLVYRTSADGWVSTQAELPKTPNLLNLNGPVLSVGSSVNSAGPTHYAWYFMESDITIPDNGLYYITANADDTVEIYIGCTRVASVTGNSSWTFQQTGLFELFAGTQTVQMRIYNKDKKRRSLAGFKLFKHNGTLVYQTDDASKWRYLIRDMDLSNMV